MSRPLTRREIAEILVSRRVAFNDDDLRRVAAYLRGKQTCNDWDRLPDWAQMCVNHVQRAQSEAQAQRK